MTTFHPFPRLPPELRLRIWELTVEPRTVDFRIADTERTMGFRIEAINGTPNNVVQLRSSTPPPATLQACREARNHLSSGGGRRVLYEQVFCDMVPPTSACAPPQHHNHPNHDEAPGPSPLNKNHHHRRYIYLHLPLDTLDIGTTCFHDFFLFSDHSHYSYLASLFSSSRPFHPSGSRSPTIPLASRVTRLKFTRNFGDEYVDRWEIKSGLRRLPSLKEVFCVCGDGIAAWDGSTEYFVFEHLPCGKEGVWLIDGKDQNGGGSDQDAGGKRARKAVEWDEVWRAFKREREREREYGGGGGGGGEGGYQYPPPPLPISHFPSPTF
ncbi:hypothetical protein QBC45DRAFT_414813 [Copromyces sp. CBS 386.78]|nr:hypothetical protein QBC45DRAFT_414813 [Copromyces sp. CBS 386.78]